MLHIVNYQRSNIQLYSSTQQRRTLAQKYAVHKKKECKKNQLFQIGQFQPDRRCLKKKKSKKKKKRQKYFEN